MYSDHMPSPLIPAPELLVTVVALEPIHLVKLLMFSEELISLKTPSAVLHSAEEGVQDVHLVMILDGFVMERLESTQCTTELVIVVAMPLVS